MSGTPTIIRSTDGENCPWQVGIHHQILQAYVAGILEDHPEGLPSDQRVNKRDIAIVAVSLSRRRCHYMKHNADRASKRFAYNQECSNAWTYFRQHTMSGRISAWHWSG